MVFFIDEEYEEAAFHPLHLIAQQIVRRFDNSQVRRLSTLLVLCSNNGADREQDA